MGVKKIFRFLRYYGVVISWATILDEATGQIVEATKSFTVLNRSIAS